jgi:hypothetical protein
MAFNSEKQYRCTIIRGKAQSEVEDLLPAYAKIITEICPCEKSVFDESFDEQIAEYLTSPTAKTIANHRTEISGKLFGMWWENKQGLIDASERTKELLENRDSPQFFKDVVSRLQFPNGMDKVQTTQNRIDHSIKIRPVSYVLKVLLLAESAGHSLTKNEIAYYILNALEVLQGEIPPEEVLAKILERRQQGVFKRVEWPGKASSFNMQHITELLNLIELANLIWKETAEGAILVKLNEKELPVIKYLAGDAEKEPDFDVYGYDYSDIKARIRMELDWSCHYCLSDNRFRKFATSAQSLRPQSIVAGDIGTEGEMLVFKKEKERVSQFNERLVNKVHYCGNRKGLGYDVQSIKADGSNTSEHAIFIEAKTTKRITKPSETFKDQFEMTRNEWTAAEQYGDNFFAYRVYLTNEGVFVFKMKNLVALKKEGVIYAAPVKYRIEFKQNAGAMKRWEN